jgi:prepilin-type N-terminal cleavage/methylation domain-containing protein
MKPNVSKPAAVKPAGFTLIELLIVVAIIAILAAIAVPNFLEAQTRAKVSRAKADQRSIATALEAYRTENNHYPEQAAPTHPDWPFARDPAGVYGGDSPRHNTGNGAIAWRLSTPVAFLSSTTGSFADPFFREFNLNSTSVVNDTRYYNYSGDYRWGRIYDAAQDGSIADFLATSISLAEKNHWHLRSRGPDNDYERRINGWADYLAFHGVPNTGTVAPFDGGLSALYDPTNGTTSSGDIARVGTLGVSNR